MASPFYIKLWNEILDDYKMGSLPDNVWRRCIELFMFAGELYRDGQLPPTDNIAYRLRQNPETLQEELEHLARVGIIEANDQGWLIIAFAERQRARTSTERSQLRRQRESRTEPAQLYGLEEPQPEAEPDLPAWTETDTAPAPDLQQPPDEPATPPQPPCNDDATKRCTDKDKDKIHVTTTAPAREANLATYYQQKSGKSPKGITDNERWIDDCNVILDLAGDDLSRAEGLVDEALVILSESGYSHNGPGSLINTIRRQLQRKTRKRPPRKGDNYAKNGRHGGAGAGQRTGTPDIQAQIDAL